MLPLLLATVVVAVGSYFVGLSAIDGMQRSQAEYEARSFAKYLIEEVPGLDDVVASGKADPTASTALGAIKPIGSVFKFRLYDRNGDLRVDSSPFAAAHIVDPRNAFQDTDAGAVGSSGDASFALTHSDGLFLPRIYSETMVPLYDGARFIGVLSVLSDQTETWPDLMAQFRMLSLQVLLLIVVAFGIPVALYIRKLAQLEVTRRRLRHSAQHDDLTGVLNRAGFARALTEQIEAARHHGTSVGVHLLDLDRFQDVNDTGGQAIGDEVLKQVATRLKRLLGSREHVARLGADEFAIVQPFHPGVEDAAGRLARNISHALSEPFAVGDTTVRTGASVSYAVYPEDGGDLAELTRAADVALHYVKRYARGTAVAFSASMEAERQSRHRIDMRLRSALANSEFDLYFQPVVNASGQLRGFEALLRLNDEGGAPISPADFIPVAEEVGLIGEIGMWALREACRVARSWPAELFVAVNLSPAQFRQSGMADKVGQVLDWSGLEPSRLEIEVTESLLITDTEKVLAELQEMKRLGVSLALDDFGTGFSSLSYLWRFPFDKLKIDRSFMVDLAHAGSRSREIISTIIALGRVLNLTITAEGVETEEQARLLRELRCDLLQGYLFGRPEPATPAAVLKWFRRARNAAARHPQREGVSRRA